jgi:hypothetical protein
VAAAAHEAAEDLDGGECAAAASGFINKRISDRKPKFRLKNPRPVASVHIYRQDAVVKRSWTYRRSKNLGGGIRSSVSSFSAASRRRMAFAFRNMEPPKIMLTLTYPREFSSDGSRIKRDLHNFKKSLLRKGVRDVAWFLEFQRRGAPHFHLFLWVPVPKKWVSSTWYRIVGSGDERHLSAGTRVEWLRYSHAAASYATKYALKNEQKIVPDGYLNVGRFWGVSRSVRPRPITEFSSLGCFARSPDPDFSGPNIFNAIRLLRRLYVSRRRFYRARCPWRDRGFGAMTLYGCGVRALA